MVPYAAAGVAGLTKVNTKHCDTAAGGWRRLHLDTSVKQRGYL